MSPSSGPVYRVGELAKLTGVTVRTLHHYDEIGLLVPTQRTGSDYRQYGTADVARLQQILSLRQLGFALDEIARVLANPGADLLTVLRLHLENARKALAAQQKLCDRLELLTDILARADSVSPDQYLKTVEATIMAENHFNLPPDELAALQAHWAKFSQADIESVQNEWPVLIGKMQAAMDAGLDPKSAEVQALAARSKELVAMFTGGNPSVHGQLKTKYETDPALQQKTGWTPELMAYMAKADA